MTERKPSANPTDRSKAPPQTEVAATMSQAKASIDTSRTGQPMATSSSGPVETPMPQNFGRYKIEMELGKGAMGVVYLAEDTQLGRKVALKIPKKSVLEEPDALERFYREAKTTSQIRHPNICPVYDVGAIDGTHYLTMAYIPGKPVSSFLGRDKLPAAKQVALLIRKIALALEEAHKQGVVHRDLKPSNVMLDNRGEPIVMDFGLARQMNSVENARLTQSGAILGTPAYMAPEQVRGELNQIGPASDIYALGVMMYQFLTGELPFTGPIMLVFAQIITEQPKPPSELRPAVDSTLEAICLKMMSKTIDQRFGSMREVAAALTEYLKTGSVSSLPPVSTVLPPATVAVPESKFDDPPALPSLADELRQPRLLKHAKSQATGVAGWWDRARKQPWFRAVAGGLGALPLLGLLAAVIFVPVGEGFVKIEVHDPSIKVSFAEQEITFETGGAPIKVRAGKQTLAISHGGLQAETKSFTLKKGETKRLTVTLVEGKVSLVENQPNDETSTAPPAIASPPSQPRERFTLLKGHREIVWGVAFSPDGQRLASGSKDGTVKIWDLTTGFPMRELINGPEVWRSVAWSPDGQLIAAGGNADVSLWNAETGEAVGKLTGHTAQIRGLAFSPDGQQLATSSCDHDVKLWNVADRVLKESLSGHTGYASAVAWSRSGQWLASGSWDRSVRLWNTETLEVVSMFEDQPGVVHSVAFSPDGQRLATATSGGNVRLWNVETDTMERELTFPQPPGRVWGVAFNPAGTLLAVGGDRQLGLWNPATGDLVEELSPMPRSGVLSLAWSPDGQRLAAGSGDVDNLQDGTIGVWTVSPSPPPAKVPFPKGSVYKGTWKNFFAGETVANAETELTVTVTERNGTEFASEWTMHARNAVWIFKGNVVAQENGEWKITADDVDLIGADHPNEGNTVLVGKVDEEGIKLQGTALYKSGARSEFEATLVNATVPFPKGAVYKGIWNGFRAGSVTVTDSHAFTWSITQRNGNSVEVESLREAPQQRWIFKGQILEQEGKDPSLVIRDVDLIGGEHFLEGNTTIIAELVDDGKTLRGTGQSTTGWRAEFEGTLTNADELGIASDPVPPGDEGGDDPGASVPAVDRSQFAVIDGRWNVENNELVHTVTDARFTHLVFGDTSWKDYDYTVDFLRGDGDSSTALIFRQDVKGFYLYGMGLGATADLTVAEVFTNETNDQGQPLWWSAVPRKRHLVLQNHVWYTARVQVRGNHFECFLRDGETETKVFDFTEDRFSTGQVGLRCGRSTYRFKNIKVTAPDGKILWEGPPAIP